MNSSKDTYFKAVPQHSLETEASSRLCITDHNNAQIDSQANPIETFDIDHQNGQSLSINSRKAQIKRKGLCKYLSILIIVGLAITSFTYQQILGNQKDSSSVFKIPFVEGQSQETGQSSIKKEINLIQQQKRKKNLMNQSECYKVELLKNYVFFISFDFQDMPKAQAQKFTQFNLKCKFKVYTELDFNYFVDIWNQREQQARFNESFIQKTEINREQKRLLLIWLILYFESGIYIHPSLGVNFGRYINDRYLVNSQVGKQLLFAKHEHINQNGIYLPERNFKTVKVGAKFSGYVRLVIQKIISKKDWIDIYEKYQCIIIKDGLTFPEEQ